MNTHKQELTNRIMVFQKPEHLLRFPSIFQISLRKEFPLYSPYCSHDVSLEFSFSGKTGSWDNTSTACQFCFIPGKTLVRFFRKNLGPKAKNLLWISCYTHCENISVGSTIDLGIPKWNRHLVLSPWNLMISLYTKPHL